MVLADGLSYARQLGATHLIDAATLTGACVVALGTVNAAASRTRLRPGEVQRGAGDFGEKFWRCPWATSS